MTVKIECISCRECFDTEKIKYSNLKIESQCNSDKMYDFAVDSGAEFDCPECGEFQVLTDCEFY